MVPRLLFELLEEMKLALHVINHATLVSEHILIQVNVECITIL